MYRWHGHRFISQFAFIAQSQRMAAGGKFYKWQTTGAVEVGSTHTQRVKLDIVFGKVPMQNNVTWTDAFPNPIKMMFGEHFPLVSGCRWFTLPEWGNLTKRQQIIPKGMEVRVCKPIKHPQLKVAWTEQGKNELFLVRLVAIIMWIPNRQILHELCSENYSRMRQVSQVFEFNHISFNNNRDGIISC